ncbi:MAG: MATE family efflux transporter, partial [Eubacterium callanderi]
MEKTEMITGSLSKIFVHYVSLNVLSMIGLSCYILADTVFVAGGVGNSGLAALNLVLPAYSFINGAGLMLGMGGATRYAVLRGEGRDTA